MTARGWVDDPDAPWCVRCGVDGHTVDDHDLDVEDWDDGDVDRPPLVVTINPSEVYL